MCDYSAWQSNIVCLGINTEIPAFNYYNRILYMFLAGSPFKIPIGEPPDPRKVRVYGPGIQNGLIQTFESKFLVETAGAGAGQLAVRIRGPRGQFKVTKDQCDNDIKKSW